MTIITDRPGRKPLRWQQGSALLSHALELSIDDRVLDRAVRSEDRSWELLAATDEFEAWVIDWPPQGAISLHDHGQSFGAVVVVRGELEETRVYFQNFGSIDLETTRLSRGGFLEIAPGVVHDVQNVSTDCARSVHVYSPRLTSMTYFNIARGRLLADQTVSYTSGSPE
jgi:predicted metal-dependent enzyme (double-stranded beta helix superfamily)